MTGGGGDGRDDASHAAADREPSASVHQEIHVHSGFGYGVIGADLHVYGDGVPVYLLAVWSSAPDELDHQFLTRVPSRMLNARFAVVDFTGRDSELEELRRWRDDDPRLAVRWLHGAGGAGKTRLACETARRARAEGWKVVTALHGPGTLLPAAGGVDLRTDDCAGLLLIVDAVEEWPRTHLMLLLSNALLQRSELRTRVLLVGRSDEAWSGVRSELNDRQIDTSALALAPLPGDGTREEMFGIARDAFSRYYSDDARDLPPPLPLDGAEFGLTLAVHLAALVAVDAHARGLAAPSDPAGLTVYLLDREHNHWQLLYGDPDYDLTPGERRYRTPPAEMNRAVYTAALAGACEPAAAGGLLARVGVAPDPARLLEDHAVCYPPDPGAGGAGHALEPLYPDRLAEDFLALTLPGHRSDYRAQQWAAQDAAALLARPDGGAGPVRWAPRAVLFLAAAAERWEHVGERCLFPLLRADPALACEAGSAALSGLAKVASVPMTLLEAVEQEFPAGSDPDLDVGIAAVARRLTAYRLARTEDPQTRAGLHDELARRLSNAGFHDEAVEAGTRTMRVLLQGARSDPALGGRLGAVASDLSSYLTAVGRYEEALEAVQLAGHALRRASAGGAAEAALRERALSQALLNLTAALARHGRFAEALEAARECAAICRRHAAVDPELYERFLADALSNLGSVLADLGRSREALDTGRAALEVWRRLVGRDPAQFTSDLAKELGKIGSCARNLGAVEEALAAARESVELNRPLAKVVPAVYEPELARSLGFLSSVLGEMGRFEQGRAVGDEAIRLRRALAAAVPAVHEEELAISLHNQCILLDQAGRAPEAVGAAEESLALWRRLDAGAPAVFRRRLAHALSTLAVRYESSGRIQDGVRAGEEAVALLEALVRRTPEVNRGLLAGVLANLGRMLSRCGRTGDAVAVTERAVAEYRRSAEHDPQGAAVGLGAAYNRLGLRRQENGDLIGAVAAFEESAARYRSLAAEQPGRFDADLAFTLRNLSPLLDQIGRAAQAAEAEAETVRVSRGLAGRSTDYTALLAGALSDLAVSRMAQRRYKEARDLAAEAVAQFAAAASSAGSADEAADLAERLRLARRVALEAERRSR